MKLHALFIIFITIYIQQIQLQSTTLNTTICKFGQFLSKNQTCVECLLSCSKCTSLELPCSGCSVGLKLVENDTKCTLCKVGEYSCSGDAVKCQRYYQWENNGCRAICQVANCGKCASIFTKQCQECIPFHILNANKTQCLPTTQNQTITPNTTNTTLPNTTRNLQQISPTFLPDENKTLINNQSTNQKKLSESINSSSLTPQQCQINQFVNKGLVCQKCSMECSTCINSAEQCLSCSLGWVKVGWKCVTMEHLVFDIMLGVKEEDRENFVRGDGLNLVKAKFIQELLPQNYANKTLSVLSITSLLYDKNTSSLDISGIIDKADNISLQDIKQTLINRLKQKKSLGPFPLTSSSVKAQNQPKTSTQSTPENHQQPSVSQANLIAILIPGIIIGVIFIIGLIVGCCKCFKCCCFQYQRSDKERIQPFDSERRRAIYQNKRNEQQPVIIPATLVQPEKGKTSPVNTHQTFKNANPINSQARMASQPASEQRLEKIVSMDSLDQMINRNQVGKQKKLILTKQQTLKQSHLTDKQVVSILHSSSNSKSSKQPTQNKLPGNYINQIDAFHDQNQPKILF